jgi:hypothetical protein
MKQAKGVYQMRVFTRLAALAGERGSRPRQFIRRGLVASSSRSGNAKAVGLLPVLIFSALALSGCATTRYAPVHCITQQQYEELRKAEPPKVGDQLSGQADKDIRIVAGSAIRLRSWGEGVLGVLGGCVEPSK